MKYRIFIIAIVLICASHLRAQNILTPDFIVISGHVVDAHNDSVLPLVNVYNPATYKGTITNDEGYFRYYGFPGDTLLLSSMGYLTAYLPVPDTSAQMIADTFYMQRDTFDLPEVSIYGLTKYEQLRYEIKNLDFSDSPEMRARANLPVINSDQLSYYSRRTDNFGLVASPISALYNAFSKEGKEMRKLRELKRRDALQARIEPRYNINLVMRITGLDKSEARKFMDFCDFPVSFLLNATEYRIIAEIEKQFERYRVSNDIKTEKEK
ncbi:MAG: carboxypeptidase-like regulatory domain-containing protein [Bacteroidales bacterium]